MAATILLVTVVLGPVLTLVVFKPGKPSLRFDLATIFVIQLGALGHGLWVAAESRPAYLVVTLHRAVLVHANELHEVPAPTDRFARPGWLGPAVVFAEAPRNPEARNALLFDVLGGAPDAEYRPGLYRDIAGAPEALWTGGEPLSHFTPDSPWPGTTAEALRALPLMTRRDEVLLVFDPIKRQILGPMRLPAAAPSVAHR